MSIELLPKNPKDRIIGCKYLINDQIRIWTGNRLNCEHNRIKNQCRECKGCSFCEHDRIKNRCKDCKGVSVCYHNRIKGKCKDCKGTSICEHNRIRTLCKNCKGSGICTHNRIRNQCKDCKGSGICTHNRIKSKCKECKGVGICEHNKIRNICKDCKGASICEHNKIRNICKECKGASICEHNKLRNLCKDCKGNSICEHNRRRIICKDCKGSGICEHNKRRHLCKDCKGSGICEHNKEKRRCRDCFTHPQNFCQLCTFVYVERSPYLPYCFKCYCYLHPDENIPRRFRMKENYINDFLKEYYPNIINNKTISSACSSGKRPDWYIELLTHTIIIECDEDQHNNYSCENKRMMQLFTDLGDRPIIFIRFNPDKYTQNNTNYEECFYYDDKNKLKVNKIEWLKRSKVLLDTIKSNEQLSDKEITIIKLYYNDI